MSKLFRFFSLFSIHARPAKASVLLALAGMCLLIPHPQQAVAQKKKWQSHFTVKDPKPSYGGRLAFSATVDQYQQIFIADLESGTVTPFLTGAANYSYPSWSHDGQWLAFVSDETGSTEIYAIRWDKTKKKQVTDNGLRKGDPSWFPDGWHIAFYQADSKDGKITNLFKAKAVWKRQKPKRLTRFKEGRNTTPRVSPDGHKIAFSTSRFWPGWDVCVWDLQKNVEKCPLSGDESFCRPFWNLDGSQMLYAHGTPASAVQIGSYNTKEEYYISLNQFPNREYDPVFGPDDKNVFFVSEGHGGKIFEVYWSRADKKDPSRLLVSKLIQSKFPIRVISWNKNSSLDLEAQLLKGAQNKGKPKKKKNNPEPKK